MRWVIYGASSFSGSSLSRWLQMHRHQVEERSLRDELEPIENCDVVINFAALNVVAPSWENMQHYIRVNVQKTGALFERLVKDCVPLYIHVSTPEVYGNVGGAMKETQPFNPSTPYAASRAAAEMLLKCYERRYGLKAIVTRACNVYGPGQQHYRLIPKLIASVKKGVRFPLEGGGTSKRAFVYIDDLCKAYELLALYGHPGEAYHITTRQLYTIKSIAKIVTDSMLALDDVIEEVPSRHAQDEVYWLDNRKLESIGWHPETGIADGVNSTIAWMDQHWNKIADKPMEYEVNP